MEESSSQLSEETKKKILQFFLKTSVPRILAEQRIQDSKNNSSS